MAKFFFDHMIVLKFSIFQAQKNPEPPLNLDQTAQTPREMRVAEMRRWADEKFYRCPLNTKRITSWWLVIASTERTVETECWGRRCNPSPEERVAVAPWCFFERKPSMIKNLLLYFFLHMNKLFFDQKKILIVLFLYFF